jgi:hypothetical protein
MQPSELRRAAPYAPHPSIHGLARSQTALRHKAAKRCRLQLPRMACHPFPRTNRATPVLGSGCWAAPFFFWQKHSCQPSICLCSGPASTCRTLLRCVSQPDIRRLRAFLPWHERNGIVWARRSAYAAPEAPGRIDIDLGKRRRVELSPELALAHTRLASCAEVPVCLANVFRSEKARGPAHLNVPLVGPTIVITVAHAHHIGSHTRPDAVHQPFVVVLAEDPLGFLFVKPSRDDAVSGNLPSMPNRSIPKPKQ